MRAGDTCSDDRRVRRRRRHFARQRVEQQAPPLRRVQPAFLGQDRRPAVAQKAKEHQQFLPVLRERRRSQFIQALERDLFIVELVEEARELRGQAHRLLVCHGRVARPDQAGEQQPAPQRPDRRRQGQLDLAVQRQFALVRLTDRHQARQQQRPPVAGALERFARGKAGAAAGQQQKGGGEPVAVPRQQALGQSRQERAIGVDGVQADHCLHL